MPGKITKLHSDDPVLNRVQDHLVQVLNPTLANTVLGMSQWRLTEGPYPTSSSATCLLVQQRTGPDTWTTICAVNVNGLVADAWTAPTLLNSWTNYGSGFNPVGYYKDRTGIVHIRGLLNGAAAATNTTVFTLPVSYRPAFNWVFNQRDLNGAARIDIGSNGNIVMTTEYTGTPVGVGSWVSLDGITFKAGA